MIRAPETIEEPLTPVTKSHKKNPPKRHDFPYRTNHTRSTKFGPFPGSPTAAKSTFKLPVNRARNTSFILCSSLISPAREDPWQAKQLFLHGRVNQKSLLLPFSIHPAFFSLRQNCSSANQESRRQDNKKRRGCPEPEKKSRCTLDSCPSCLVWKCPPPH